MRKRGQRDDGKLAALEFAQAGRRRRDPFEPDIRALDFVEQRQRGHGRTQPAVHAFEQRKADALLHAREFAAHRGLRGEEHLGRFGDAACRHQRAEDFDMSMGERHVVLYQE